MNTNDKYHQEKEHQKELLILKDDEMYEGEKNREIREGYHEPTN